MVYRTHFGVRVDQSYLDVRALPHTRLSQQYNLRNLSIWVSPDHNRYAVYREGMNYRSFLRYGSASEPINSGMEMGIR
jgi:hypothetical protein